MSSILDNIINIVPEKDSYIKISSDEKLAEMALKRWEQLENGGLKTGDGFGKKFNNTHSYKGIDYRRSAHRSTVYDVRADLKEPESGLDLEQELISFLGDEIVDYLGLKYFLVNEVRFEETKPNKFLENIHNKYNLY